MNPRSHRQKVAVATISDYGGEHKFHCTTIPDTWLKVDVQEALMPEVALMFPNEAADQAKVKDAVGSNAIWDQKYVKLVT
jgi:hypothetical protein